MSRPSALVLGGGGGIGAAVSRRLAAEHAVAIGCWHDATRARTLRDELTEQGAVAEVVQADAADVAPARQSTYAAAKAGLEAATRVAAKELAGRGITVNAVRPGATDTETLRKGTSERAIEAMSASNAMRRLGTPEDVAGAVMMLRSPDAAWVTGTVLDATGGLR